MNNSIHLFVYLIKYYFSLTSKEVFVLVYIKQNDKNIDPHVGAVLYKLYNKQGHGTPLTLDKEYFQTALHANTHYLIFKIKVFWQKMIE